MKKLFVFGLLLSLFACTTETEPTDAPSDAISDQEDTTAQIVEYTPEPQLIPELFEEIDSELRSLSLPITNTSEELKKVEGIELNYMQFKFLSNNFLSQQEYDDYFLTETREMYERKMNNLYDDYESSLDLGQLRDAVAFAYGKIETDSTLILLWKIEYSSFEACPFYSGDELFASVIQHDAVQVCIQLAEESSGGDPPAFGETLTEFSLSEKLELDRKTIQLEYEDEDLINSDTTRISHTISW